MTSKQFFILIAIIAALGIGLGVALKGCNSKPVSITDSSVDSLKAVQHFKDSVYKRTVILLNNSISAARFKSDSLSFLIEGKDKALEVSKAKVALLIAKGSILPTDSIKQRLDNCDSIKREAIYLAENVTDYQRAQETLMENNKNLLVTMQRTSELKDSMYADLKGDFNFLANKYSQLDHNYLIEKKQANKRFGLSLFGGYTYVTDKFRPVVGAGITFSIIKF